MSIGWYPGHMNKARKDITKALQSVDAVIEILDARLPFSSSNPLLDQLINDTPRLRVLNKSDLADPAITQTWLEYFSDNEKNHALALNKSESNNVKGLSSYCYKHFRKPDKRHFSLMVLGIPNVGKSTLLNLILDRKIAKVGNEPAVTKNRQRVKLNESISISDTPGILWPKIEPQDCGYRLAVSGAIKNTAFEFEDIALWLIDYLKQCYPTQLSKRYQLPHDNLAKQDAQALLEEIAHSCGCLKRGGVNYTKASETLLHDFRSSKLGRLSLETPKDIPQPESEKNEQQEG